MQNYPITHTALTQLAFPLNVFACATFLQEGQVDYLHYGLFDEGHTSIRAAQTQSTEMILRRLPARGARVLEIGIGLGATAKILADLGLKVTGIAPDPAQVEIARARSGGAVQFEVERFEHYSAPVGGFDFILLQESSQYLEPELLFSKAYELLEAGGRMLILDQFVLRRANPPQGPLHYGPDFIALAEGQGFKMKEHLDLSTRATPTLDYILKILDAHKDALLELIPIEAAELAALRDAVAANRENYHRSILGYALYDLRR